MKKYKQILALALVLMLTMTLFACNKEENKETKETTETTDKTENTEETKTEDTEETESEATETAELPQDALSVEIKKAQALDEKYENAYALLDTADEANKAKYDEIYPNDPYKLDIELKEADEANKANYISLLDDIIKMDRKLDEATPENPYDTKRNKGEKVLTEILLATEEGKDTIFYANRDLYKFLALELETGDDLKLKDWTIAADETRNVILGYNQKDRYELGKTYEIDYFGNKLKIMPVGVAKEGAKYVNGNGDEISLDNTIIAALNYDDSKALLNDDECKSLVDSAVIISPEADKAMYLGNYIRGEYKAVHLSDLVK